MRSLGVWLWTILLVSTLLEGFAFAGEGREPYPPPERREKPLVITRSLAKELVGKEVWNNEDQDLGSISELVVDPAGRIRYLILQHGGVFGIGARMIPIPWEVVRLYGDKVVVNVSWYQLTHAPSFPSDQWPDFTTPWFNEMLHAYYGAGAPNR